MKRETLFREKHDLWNSRSTQIFANFDKLSPFQRFRQMFSGVSVLPVFFYVGNKQKNLTNNSFQSKHLSIFLYKWSKNIVFLCTITQKLLYLRCLSVIMCEMSVLACVPDGGGGCAYSGKYYYLYSNNWLIKYLYIASFLHRYQL